MFEKFTGLYPLHKSLRFELIPNPKTKEMIQESLNEDVKRSEQYKVIKGLIDDYYRYYIECILDDFSFSNDDLKTYLDMFNGNKDYSKLNEKMRKQLSQALQKSLEDYGLKNYSKLFGKEGLPLNEWIKGKYDNNQISEKEYNDYQEVIQLFNGFITYFATFQVNRNNMFSEEDKASSIPNRSITVNLTKFINNINNYNKAITKYPNLENLLTIEQKAIFSIDYYNKVLSQKGINAYNTLLGRSSDKIYEKGINQIINEFIQKNKLNKYAIVPMETLYSQILSEKKSIEFEFIESDKEMLSMIKEVNIDLINSLDEIKQLIKMYFVDDNRDKLYVNGKTINELSQKIYKEWDVIRKSLKSNSVENNDTYSIKEIESSLEEEKAINLLNYFNEYDEKILNANYGKLKEIFEKEYIDEDRKVATATFKGGKGYQQIQLIKNYMDEVVNLIHFYKPLYLYKDGKKIENNNKLDDFYIAFDLSYQKIKDFELVYNKIRNYLTTKKTFSTEKIRQFLNCSSLLTGWSDEFKRNECSIYYDGKYYYLVDIISNDFKVDSKLLDSANEDSNAFRMIYNFQKPDNKNIPRLFIRSKGDSYSPNVEKYNLPINDIIDIYDSGKFKTEYRKINAKEYKESLIKLIDYFKMGLKSHEDYCDFNFAWKESKEYENISEFYKDCADSCYSIEKRKIDFDYLLKLENNEKVLIFKIYNKDFSEYSKGNPNLHTLYFKALFSNENIKNINDGNPFFKLDGGASLYFRKSSLERKVTHPKNVELNNKNPLNAKKTSLFAYDLIKNKRYTEDKMFLHFPITMNVRGTEMLDSTFNEKVNGALYSSNDVNFIGLDRGERHLLYYTIVNKQGQIIKQGSFNNVINESNSGLKMETNYHDLLDNREKERDKARKEWAEIEQIKDLKDGYMSNIIYQLSKMMIEYNAVLVLEKLDKNFTRSRTKIEKQVYQKFEKAITDKLNYLAFKDRNDSEDGSIYKGYQLTNPMANLDKIGYQNGFIYYISPSYTSKICPRTGFISQKVDWSFYSVKKSKELLTKLNSFVYCKKYDCFKFEIDYKKFTNETYGNTKWDVYTIGKERYGYSNKKPYCVDVTSNLKGLFNSKGIIYESEKDILSDILELNDTYSFETIMNCIKLTLQLRHSSGGSEDKNDYILSPIMDKNGEFFDSRYPKDYEPKNADANGAYHIALKGLYSFENMNGGKIKGPNLNEWLEYRQKNGRSN